MKDRSRLGFTLIELMAVVVIILILLGLVFKIGASVGAKIKIAQTVSRLEHLKMCIEEYYVKWGQYPPVSGGTECEWINATERFGMDDEYDAVAAAYDESGTSFNEHESTLPAYLYEPTVESESMTGNEIGEYRDQTGWGSAWPGDDDEWQTPESIIHDARWEDYHDSVGWYCFSNRVYSIRDSWGGLFHYKVGGGYQSYRVWSNGADGTPNTADDVGLDSFVN